MAITNHDNGLEVDRLPSSVARTVQQYFEVVFSNDLDLFDLTFHERAQLHGFATNGSLVVWSARDYREVLSKRPSPKSLGAMREEETVQVDVASDSHAFAKVRVRINQTVFIDYLTMLKVDHCWRIVSKTFVGFADPGSGSPP
jgi:hypothetical protein